MAKSKKQKDREAQIALEHLMLNDVGKFVDLLKDGMEETDEREFLALSKTTSRMWRNYWIRLAHRQGYNNVTIAKHFDLSESTIRYILLVHPIHLASQER